MSVQVKKVKHVHFAPDQLSGSHNPPDAFRIKSKESFAFSTTDVDFPSLDKWEKIPHRVRTTPPPLKTQPEIWKARGTALIDTVKGIASTLLATIKFLFAKVFNKADVLIKEKIMKQQWETLKLNALAIWDPSSLNKKC